MHTFQYPKDTSCLFICTTFCVVFLLLIIGCTPQKVGTATVSRTLPDKTIIEAIVTNPPKAQAPATVKMSEVGEIEISVSPPRKEDTALKHLWFVPWVGAGLMVLGISTLALKSQIPLIPSSASILLIVTGGVLLAIPKVVQEAWWLIPIGLAISLFWWLMQRDNRKLILTTPTLSKARS